MSSGDSYKTQAQNFICNVGEKCKQAGGIVKKGVEIIPHKDAIVSVTTGATTAVVAVPTVISGLGFKVAGIKAGSVAASWMATYSGTVASGSLLSTLQSAGVIGLGSAATGGIAIGTGAVVYGGIKLYRKATSDEGFDSYTTQAYNLIYNVGEKCKQAGGIVKTSVVSNKDAIVSATTVATTAVPTVISGLGFKVAAPWLATQGPTIATGPIFLNTLQSVGTAGLSSAGGIALGTGIAIVCGKLCKNVTNREVEENKA